MRERRQRANVWMPELEGVKNRLLQITREFKTQLSIYNAAIRHPRTRWLARWLLVTAIAYLASPIDLIPDFIPVLGHLDDFDHNSCFGRIGRSTDSRGRACRVQ
jgi:uncharacterized membrane protein YkvA (DUF1232 family)